MNLRAAWQVLAGKCLLNIENEDERLVLYDALATVAGALHLTPEHDLAVEVIRCFRECEARQSQFELLAKPEARK